MCSHFSGQIILLLPFLIAVMDEIEQYVSIHGLVLFRRFAAVLSFRGGSLGVCWKEHMTGRQGGLQLVVEPQVDQLK